MIEENNQGAEPMGAVPVKDNAYLYAVLVRRVDKSETIAEAKAEQEKKTGPRAAHVDGKFQSVSEAISAALPNTSMARSNTLKPKM